MTLAELKKVMSPYLLEGYKQDKVEVEKYNFFDNNGKSTFSFSLKVKESFLSSQYGIFFSGITAEVWIYQACVVLAHLDNDLFEQRREIVLQEKNVTYHKPVPADNIVVSAQIEEKRTTKKGNIQYKFAINVSDAITGYGIAIF